MNKGISILLLIGCFTLNAQDNDLITITAKITDVTTSEPLPGAIAFLVKNNQVGSVAGADGIIRLTFPRRYLSDSIMVHALGFKSKLIALNGLPSDELFVLKMEPLPIQLNEIFVYGKQYDIPAILVDVFSNISKHYPVKKHQLSGFLRIQEFDRSGQTGIAEAAIVIQDPGYVRDINTIRMAVEHFRSTNFVFSNDSLPKNDIENDGAFPSRANNPFFNFYEFNEFRNAVAFPVSKSDREAYYRNFKIQVDSSSIEPGSGDTLCYTSSGGSYKIFNLTDHALIESYRYSQLNGNLIEQYTIKYKEIAGRYYPVYIKLVLPDVRIKGWVKNGNMITSTFWVDKVGIEDTERLKHLIKRTDSFDPPKNNDEVFWKDYPMLKLHPVDGN